jgi:hypothetical protein
LLASVAWIRASLAFTDVWYVSAGQGLSLSLLPPSITT